MKKENRVLQSMLHTVILQQTTEALSLPIHRDMKNIQEIWL